MVKVDVGNSILQANSELKLMCVVWFWRSTVSQCCSKFIGWTGWTLLMAL